MTRIAKLDHLSVVSITGADAGTFLQSQLSANLEAPDTGVARITSWNSAAGKTIASPWLMGERAGSHILILPSSLTEVVVKRLSMFVLRSRVSIDIASDLGVFGTSDAELQPEGTVAAAVPDGERPRRLFVADAAFGPTDASGEALVWWREADLRAGLPQVYPQTSEKFIPQMLNLDVLGGVSFDKGCYPGQEVIARARYLGRVKRRMHLFSGRGLEMPSTGGPLGDLPSSTVVDACESDSGWLALAVLPGLPEALPAGIEAVPLPYSLPD